MNKKIATRYIRKRVVFRNKSNICFGMISSEEPCNSNFRDFGRLININGYYVKGKIILKSFKKEYVEKQWKNGVLLKGFRDNRIYKTLRLPPLLHKYSYFIYASWNDKNI